MIYKTNSFQRYKEGEALVEKYNTKTNVMMLLILVFGIAGLAIHAKYNTNFLLSLLPMFIPGIIGIRWATKVSTGALMKQTALKTYGNDEEEYDSRI